MASRSITPEADEARHDGADATLRAARQAEARKAQDELEGRAGGVVPRLMRADLTSETGRREFLRDVRSWRDRSPLVPHPVGQHRRDRKGVSFYACDRICSALEITPDDYVAARNRLIDKDLIAFDGTRFQVLSLPDAPVPVMGKPLVDRVDYEEHDPATIRALILESLPRRGRD